MRICFIADSSSIHVQRMISYYVRKKDDILVLSSAPYISEIPGTRTIHLLDIDRLSSVAFYKNTKAQKKSIAYLKSFIPISTKLLILEMKRCLHLLSKRVFCIEEIQHFNPEVIFCNRSFPEGVLAPYCHVRPLLLRTAGSDISLLPKYPMYRQIVRKALQTADLLVTESFWEKKLLRDLGGNGLKAEVIIIGVDTTLFDRPVSKDSVRGKYILPRDAFVVVCNRSLNGVYNGWLIVEAMQSIFEECPNLVLLYVSPSKMDLRTEAKARNIAACFPRVKFIDDGVPHSEVPDILGCGDIYISFSSYDGIPNSVLEAMACGLIPIVAELPQLHEWIEHGITGYFVQQYDTKRLASVISDLYKNRQQLPDMSDRCVSLIRERGSYEECMERARDLMKQLI